MRLRCIGCEVLARPLYDAAARSRHAVDVTLLRRGLHDTPVTLRARLQAEIDRVIPGSADAVVLGYGLCGGATAGIAAGAVPLVLPRAHDCVTVLLGDRRRYAREFAAHPGTYWYSADYVERSAPRPGDAATGLLGIGASSPADVQAAHASFVERFGVDNADFLMEALGAWRAHYDRAVFVDSGLGDPAQVESLARDEAGRRGWAFERMPADLLLLRRLLDGDWRPDEVLVLQPGERLAPSYDDDVIRPAARDRELLA